MKYLVIGGSGRSGQLVISEAIRKGTCSYNPVPHWAGVSLLQVTNIKITGHEIIALVRNKSSLEERKGLEVVTGSPLSTDDISRAIAASDTPVDAVLVTMNARRASDSPFAAPDPVDSPPRLMADSIHNTLVAMKSASPPIRKIVAMSSVGTGSSWDNVNCLMRLVFDYTNMRHSREDHDAVDQELRQANDIKFVEVRPWMLTEGEAAEVKVYGDDGKGAGFLPKISRASVATFMVEAAETSKYDGQSPVITN